MRAITSSFINITFIWVIIFALVQLFYYFKFKRNVNLSDVDRSLWQLKLSTIFLAVLVIVATVYLPTTGFYSEIDPLPAARENAFQNLIRNQQRMGNQLDQLREVLYILFLTLWFYLIGAINYIGRLWQEKRKLASINDPVVKKPLSLDTD